MGEVAGNWLCPRFCRFVSDPAISGFGVNSGVEGLRISSKSNKFSDLGGGGIDSACVPSPLGEGQIPLVAFA